MAIETKEIKIIDHSNNILEELRASSKDEQFILEYENLLKEYTRLSKKFDKTIILNDVIGKYVIDENEQLEVKIDSTIKNAREKIMEKISLQNKSTQEIKELQTYIKTLENDLDSANLKIKNLEKKVKALIDSEIEYKEDARSKISSYNINSSEIRFFSFNQLLTNQIHRAVKGEFGFVVLKLTIDNYTKIKNDLKRSGSEDIFLKGTLRYLQSTVSKNDVVYFSHHNVFYLLFENTNLESVRKKVEPLNKKRELAGLTVNFSIGATEFKKDDTADTIMTRCNLANDEAALENTKASFVVEN